MSLPNKPFYRPDEIADHFRVSKAEIYKQIQNGDLAAIRVGSSRVLRIPREAVEGMQNPVEERG